LFFVITSFSNITFQSFYIFMYVLAQFTFISFLILYFAEKFTCFKAKCLKLVNSILLGITTLGFVINIIRGWNYNFSIETLILFILILAANAYWAYDLIMGFLAVQKEMAAKKEAEKPAEEPVKEEEKVEEKPAEEPAKEAEKTEEKEEEKKEEPEEEEKDEEKEESDDDEEKKDE